ncbi:MAG: hypothetical protein R2932_44520 [Caldilineaceae bacterium]
MVIANGRGSPHRVQAGFVVQRDPVKRQIAGLHLENFPLQEDASHIFSRPGSGWMAVFFPQGNGRVRSYVMYPKSSPLRIQGASDIPQYTNQMVALGVPATLFAHARATGPLATFDGADVWVDSPYRNGIVLIGDAAAANDPSFGCGLSLTVRDVRTLRDHLLQHEDWDVAGHAYATEHDQYYGILHTVTGWMGQLLFDIGPEADARRARALPLLAEDSTRALDHIFSGPDRPVDETTRRRYFGEE